MNFLSIWPVIERRNTNWWGWTDSNRIEVIQNKISWMNLHSYTCRTEGMGWKVLRFWMIALRACRWFKSISWEVVTSLNTQESLILKIFQGNLSQIRSFYVISELVCQPFTRFHFTTTRTSGIFTLFPCKQVRNPWIIRASRWRG